MTTPASIASILGLSTDVRTLNDLDSAVSFGLPRQAVLRVLSHLAPDKSQVRAIRESMVPSATWKRTKGRLSHAASERTERLARIIAAAEFTWDDPAQARAWLNHPHPELANRTPLAAATTELGARSVENILDALFYGLPA